MTQISGPGISASYSYNGLDTRVGKTENSVSNTFRRSGAYVTDPVLGDGTASYTPGVSRRTGTETRYFHTGLKNTDSLTNPGQTVAASRIYDVFGNVVSSSGTWSGPFGYAGNFGYQSDASGLKLLGHRYYDPSTGRFLTRDPIKDGRNWYAYGAGEAAPTTMADPTGLVATAVIVVLAIVVIAGGLYVLGETMQDRIQDARESQAGVIPSMSLEVMSVTSDNGTGLESFIGSTDEQGNHVAPQHQQDRQELVRQTGKFAADQAKDQYITGPILKCAGSLLKQFVDFGDVLVDSAKGAASAAKGYADLKKSSQTRMISTPGL